MAHLPDIVSSLGPLIGPSSLSPATENPLYTVDGLVPAAVVHPTSVEEMSRVVAMAQRERLGVIPWGGGTGQRLGAPPRAVDVVVTTNRLARVLEANPEDLTITVEAGITLAKLQQTLAIHGQFLPMDPPQPEQATVGGILACNASGPLRLAYGTARDLVLGMAVVYPTGAYARSGGKVVKNVAGYDMAKLHIGALGTLGIIVEVTFKVLPLPKTQETVVIVYDHAQDALRAVADLRMGAIAPLAIEYITPHLWQELAAKANLDVPKGHAVLALFGGPEAVVAGQLTRLRRIVAPHAATQAGPQAPELWCAIRNWPGSAATGDAVLCRIGILPTMLPRVVAALNEQDTTWTGLAHAATAVLYVVFSPYQPDAIAHTVSDLRALVDRLGGSIVIEACPPAFKGQVDVWGHPDATMTIMQKLKDAFDPAHVLNPGRYLGGI